MTKIVALTLNEEEKSITVYQSDSVDLLIKIISGNNQKIVNFNYFGKPSKEQIAKLHELTDVDKFPFGGMDVHFIGDYRIDSESNLTSQKIYIKEVK